MNSLKINTSFKISPNHDETNDGSNEEEETKEEPKYKIIIASYSQEAFYRVPQHITAEDCFIKYGTLQYEDNGELIEDDKYVMSDGDLKYPSEITDAEYDDYDYFFE